MKGGTNHNSTVVANKGQGSSNAQPAKIQPTAEQIRYAKLAQLPGLEESMIQEKIREVSEVTGKASDVVSVALHESNYEVTVAVQNILDGHYECLDTEWQTKPSKKKKTTNQAPTGYEKNEHEEQIAENHIDIEDEEKPSGKPISKGVRGGRRGGRIKRFDQNSDDRSFGDDTEREFRNDQGFDRMRSGDRGRGRPRGRGRGALPRGGGNRRGGFGGRGGGGGFPAPVRGGPKVRGRGFSRRPRLDRDGQNAANDPSDEISPSGLVPEKETWDIDEFENKPPITDWADSVESEEKAEEWSQDQWITPVSEDNTASLFANSIMSSSVQSENWNHVNGPDTKWNRSSPNQPHEESLYRPENVDAAVIMSQRAQPAPESESFKSPNELSRPIYTSSLQNSQFPSSHQDSSLTSSLLGRPYNIEDLAKSFRLKNHISDGTTSSVSATMITGVHDSHKLEQEQLQPSKTQRQPKAKRIQKPQVSSQPVEMPKSIMEELEQQLGGLEFGSGPVSPKFGSESQPSFVPTSSVTTTVFQQSSPANLTSTVHHETVRHSVAIAEDPSTLVSPSQLPVSNVSKSDRPKTPPGLSSLPEHQSPARHYSPSSSRDINRIAQVTNPIPFPSNSLSPNQSLTTASTLNPSTESLQASLGGSFSNARNALQGIASVQESNSGIIGVIGGLNELPLNNHLNQKSGNSFSSVDDAFASANMSSKTPALAQPLTTASFTKPSIPPPPGVLPSGSHVTYSSATLASQVLGFTSTQTTTPAQAALKAPANTSKLAGAGPPGMLPVNMYTGMQQGMIPTAYPAYSYEDMQMLQRIPMVNPSYYDVMYQTAGANRENIGTNFQAGDNKFARDASSPVASTINTGNPHAAHAQQQAAFLNAAAATPLPYGYAYYTPGMIPGSFPVFTTAAVYQMPPGKGHMGGAHYQTAAAAYNPQHTAHAFNSAAGANQDFEKGPYLRSATQTLQHNKNGQPTGAMTGGPSTSENVHHAGFKSQPFNQDAKSYQLAATPPSMSIPLPHAQSHMPSYTPYVMQHHASMMHQNAGHIGHQQQQQQQLDSSNPGSLVGRSQQQHHGMPTSQQHHGMATSQQPKRDVKGQGYGSSYWPGTN